METQEGDVLHYYTQCVQYSTHRSPSFTFCHMLELKERDDIPLLLEGKKVVLNLRIILHSSWKIS
jgi:hypothetical protein